MERMRKNVLVFGIGKAYKNRKHYFEWNDRLAIVGFVDNNSSVQGNEIDGVKVYAPTELQNLNYDAIVLLSNQFYEEQQQQLLGLGVSSDKIWDYYRLKREFALMEGVNERIEISKDDLLIVTFQFGVDGGSLATLYLAEALKNDWKNVYIATDNITEDAKRIVKKYGFKMLIHKSLPYMSEGFVDLIKESGYVIVNTLQMLPVAISLRQIGMPTCMWIHEGEEVWYKSISGVVEKNDIPKELPILFVSEVSKELFRKYYVETANTRVVSIAIPDRARDIRKNNESLFRIAVIGSDTPNKNMMLILKAMKKLPEEYRCKCQIDFYGVDDAWKKRTGDYAEGICKVVARGLVEPEELHGELDCTDCVVCTSLKECLPTTAIEGFMHKCIVVVPDSAGIAKYINDGENGFVYKVNDEKSLAKKIKEILDYRTNDMELRNNSRKLYEKYFTYESLRKSFLNLMMEK